MKKIRWMALVLALVMLMGLLAACGQTDGGDPAGESSANDNSTLSGMVTLAQYLANGPCVGFYSIGEPDKNESPRQMWLFEDGKVYRVFGPRDEEGTVAFLTWGEISKMTDEELLDYAREYKALDWGGWTRYPTGEYAICVTTDNTGNNLKYERILVKECEEWNDPDQEWTQHEYCDIVDKGQSFDTTHTATIYDSVFSGIAHISSEGRYYSLFFRTGSDLRITLDNPGDEGVEVD